MKIELLSIDIKVIFAVLLLVGMSFLSACQQAVTPQVVEGPSPTPDVPVQPTAPEEAIVDTPLVNITSVTVERGEQINFSGRTSVPEGECLYSQLYQNETLVEWWPAGKCFPVTGMDWTISVSLGEEGVPEDLDRHAEYTLKVWWPGEPEVASNFFTFDLSSPPQPHEQ